MRCSVNQIECSSRDVNLIPICARIRIDQKKRLEIECRARGIRLADGVRDNLDLAFAMKEELAKIVEGTFDENDPHNAPRLAHALLFRVEERILSALDNLAIRLETQIGSRAGTRVRDIEAPSRMLLSQSIAEQVSSNGIGETIDDFVSLIASGTEQPLEIWIGAFLEIVPRLELVGADHLNELKYKGELWLEEHGYYAAGNGATGPVKLLGKSVEAA